MNVRPLARRISSLALAFSALLPSLARAQSDTTSKPQKTFFVASDLAWLGAFGAASYGVSRFDVRVARWFQQPAQQLDHSKSSLANNFSKIQETTLTLGGLATYGIARLTHRGRDVQDIALHATEAVVLASLSSQVIRGPLGRSRPHVTNFADQYDFHWFKGFGNFDYRSYPSIHTSSSFAAATVIALETHRRSPRSTWIVAPIAYVLAAGPGYSRMYLGQHWASDIFMGAFMGTFYGARVVDYNHEHPGNKVDRFFLGRAASGLSLAPIKGGMEVGYSAGF